DVMEVARCLTGWTVRSKDQKPYFQIGKVDFNPSLHDYGSKEILGKVIPSTPANLGKEELERRGRLELDRVLSIVTKHPATAQHISTKLCRHFISETPPQSVVDRVATAFTESDGNIKVTLKSLFNSNEFWESSGTKFKRPFTFIVSALRATNARTDSSLSIIDFLQRMGHAPFNFPTPDGYPEQAAPWMGTLLWRWNFAVALSENKIKGTTISLDKLLKNAGGDEALMAHVLGRKATKEEAQAYRESEAGLALLLACPAFQRC
ncbi:MAG: hypothetical protein JWN25_3061, partial [Verrucomicrobiales bacterium]|nr:hypothetical protein [Verrucomicrobiales bacterium]